MSAFNVTLYKKREFYIPPVWDYKLTGLQNNIRASSSLQFDYKLMKESGINFQFVFKQLKRQK